MPLIDRIAGLTDPDTGPPRIAVDLFWAHLYELAQGQITQQQIITTFELSASEQTELSWLVGKYNAQPNATAKAKFIELMRVIFMMAESRVPGYITNAGIVARINAI